MKFILSGLARMKDSQKVLEQNVVLIIKLITKIRKIVQLNWISQKNFTSKTYNDLKVNLNTNLT